MKRIILLMLVGAFLLPVSARAQLIYVDCAKAAEEIRTNVRELDGRDIRTFNVLYCWNMYSIQLDELIEDKIDEVIKKQFHISERQSEIGLGIERIEQQSGFIEQRIENIERKMEELSNAQ
ncbi:MAG: hypothetical protein AAGE89_08510 [Pseudomonadota bacterium]